MQLFLAIKAGNAVGQAPIHHGVICLRVALVAEGAIGDGVLRVVLSHQSCASGQSKSCFFPRAAPQDSHAALLRTAFFGAPFEHE
jgi:hypothetical protein